MHATPMSGGADGRRSRCRSRRASRVQREGMARRASRRSALLPAQAAEAVGQRADLDGRSHLLRYVQAALETARCVLRIAALLVDRADQAQALDLPPAVAAAAEHSQRFAREILGMVEVAKPGAGLSQVERRERGELGVLAFATDVDRLAEEILRELRIPTVEGDAAVVDQRGRL